MTDRDPTDDRRDAPRGAFARSARAAVRAVGEYATEADEVFDSGWGPAATRTDPVARAGRVLVEHEVDPSVRPLPPGSTATRVHDVATVASAPETDDRALVDELVAESDREAEEPDIAPPTPDPEASLVRGLDDRLPTVDEVDGGADPSPDARGGPR